MPNSASQKILASLKKEDIWVAGFFVVGVLATAALFYHFSMLPALFEPDRLFHLALLRESQDQNVWVLRHWGQLPLLGWNEFFSDKEFLFHFILRIPYKLFGEKGAIATTLGFSALLIWLPFLYCKKHRFFALAVGIAVIPANNFLLYRFCLIRPHTLAALIYALMLLLCLRGKFKWAALMALLYCLAYHAFYLVFLLAGLVFLTHELFKRVPRWSDGENEWAKGSAWLIGGALTGLLLNPYFPANLVQSFQHLILGFHVPELEKSLHLVFGGELVPRPASAFFAEWWGMLLALTGAFFLMKGRKITREVFLLSALAAVYTLGCLKTPRMLEFTAPIWFLFLASSYSTTKFAVKFSLVAFLLLAQAPNLFALIKAAEWSQTPPSPSVQEISEVLEPIRKLTGRVRIYHDNWGIGPYIIYLLPNAEAIELLDPTFLLIANPKLSALRTELNAGHLGEPVRAIREGFGASYALLEMTPLRHQLLQVKGMKALSTTANRGYVLFELP